MSFVNNAAPFLALAAAIIALCYAVFQFCSVKSKPEGTEQMKNISAKIRQGAMAYLKRQYKTVSIFFAIMFVILLVLSFSGVLWFCYSVRSICIFNRWILLRSFRICRHEDCNLCKLQNCQRCKRGLKPGVENCIFFRYGYGTYRCRSRTF